ncbi:MAG TPA: hypothetical protein C5S51_07945 [Methanosarcinaceae archaeon]|nr:hypothetical protein [Methanosarcinaceae archaeon]
MNSHPSILKITTHIPDTPNNPDIKMSSFIALSAPIPGTMALPGDSRSTPDSSMIGWWKCPKIRTSTHSAGSPHDLISIS